VRLGVVGLPYRVLYRIGCLFELFMPFGVIAIFIIAVGFASRCACGLATVHPKASVSHCWALQGLPVVLACAPHLGAWCAFSIMFPLCIGLWSVLSKMRVKGAKLCRFPAKK